MAIDHHVVEDVCIITFDDGKVNALNPELISGLSHALDEAEGSRAVVLRGRPRVFCAGLDLKLVDGTQSSRLKLFLKEFNEFLYRLLLYPRPLVAECGGHAVGAGCLLLVACDIRVGTGHGRAGVSGVHLGLPFPSGALAVAQSCLNQQALNRSLLLGEIFSGHDRVDQGFLSEVVAEENLRECALERARVAAKVNLSSFASTRLRLREDVVTKARAQADEQNSLFTEALASVETQRRIQEILSRVSTAGTSRN